MIDSLENSKLAYWVFKYFSILQSTYELCLGKLQIDWKLTFYFFNLIESYQYICVKVFPDF